MSSRQGQRAVQETNLRHVVHPTSRQRVERHVVHPISLRHAGHLINRQRAEQHVVHPINKQKFQERRSGSHEPVFFISMAHYR